MGVTFTLNLSMRKIYKCLTVSRGNPNRKPRYVTKREKQTLLTKLNQKTTP